MNPIHTRTMRCVLTLVAALLLAPCHALLADDPPESRFAAMSPAEVRAYERDTLRRVADLALIPPVLNTAPLPQYDYDKLDYGMTIGIERTPKGRLWACWVAGGDSPKAFFVLATSDDDGETWQGGLVLDERKGVSYPDGFQSPDGTIFISYDRNRATDGEVLLARFTEADVLAKQLTGPTSKLKILISRPLAHRASSRVAEPAAAAGKAATPPTFSGPTPGTLREISIPTVDISGEAKRHSIVARGTPEAYQGHCDTVLVGEVAPKSILAFDGGKRLVMWSDRRDPKSPSDPHPVVWQSESFDGGLTWQKERVILGVPGQWAQPSVVRSPDGKQLLMLMRENTRRHNSLFSVSDDDARTWSEPKELPAALTGDRHVMKYAPDGRLVVAMRDTSKTSPTYGHYVAWVGRYQDIIGRRHGHRGNSEPLLRATLGR